jgi:hypothetical protein
MNATAAGNRSAGIPSLRAAGAAAMVSGLAGIPMVATLLAMYIGFALGPDARQTALRLGGINDALAIFVYGLALPVVPAMHVLVRESGATWSVLLAAIGATGIVVTMILQWLLVTGALTFEQQILPVSIALMAVGAWMVGTGVLARRAGVLPTGLRDGVLGALYVGYPIWAFRVGRRLLRGAR